MLTYGSDRGDHQVGGNNLLLVMLYNAYELKGRHIGFSNYVCIDLFCL
jgi:hypothetical protein